MGCTRSTRTFLTSTCLTALVVALSCGLTACEDNSLEGGATPEIELRPDSFNYTSVAMGQNNTQVVEVINVGNAQLAITSVSNLPSDEYELTWRYDTDEANARFALVDRGNAQRQDGPIVIEPEQTVFLYLNYAPLDEGTDPGTLVINTNDPANREVALPIVHAASGPELRISPRVLDFERVAANATKTMTATVNNVGTEVLFFNAMNLAGSADYSVQIRGEDPINNAMLLADPDGDGQEGLAPQSSFEIQVTYAPPAEGSDSGELAIQTNDPISPISTLELTANGATPCIEVVPADGLAFGAGLVDADNEKSLVIASCGGEPLDVSSIRLSDDTDAAFTLSEADVADITSAPLPARTPDQDPPSRLLTVTFSPDAEEVYDGTIIIESNDGFQPTLEVPLSGRGLQNVCPVPQVQQDEFAVLPLDIITLNGGPSIDEDSAGGRPVRYEWTVIERPMDSTSQPVERFSNVARPADGGPADDPATPEALFFVDLAGDYVIELRVTDEQGLSAPSDICPEPVATINITATPDGGILAQMSWTTPADDNETDNVGTDIDIHMLYPQNLGWNIQPGDCYFANTNPDWGQLGDPADDCTLDIDDTNGAGPENISVDRPEDTSLLGGLYEVGVLYYRSEIFGGAQLGASLVTMRIFLGGVLEWEGSREMQVTGNFWHVVGIEWIPAQNVRRVVARDRFYNSVP
ncbi:MAG: choice-of-anchor D domain-containing protein [Bradymonadia bacterium]